MLLCNCFVHILPLLFNIKNNLCPDVSVYPNWKLPGFHIMGCMVAIGYVLIDPGWFLQACSRKYCCPCCTCLQIPLWTQKSCVWSTFQTPVPVSNDIKARMEQFVVERTEANMVSTDHLHTLMDTLQLIVYIYIFALCFFAVDGCADWSNDGHFCSWSYCVYPV